MKKNEETVQTLLIQNEDLLKEQTSIESKIADAENELKAANVERDKI